MTNNPDGLSDARAVTLFREIDALGGTGLPSEGESWSRGYSEALTDVLAILAKRGFTEQRDATPPASASTAIAAGERTEIDRIIRWIDQAIERADRHKNTEGIWLFAKQWRVVRNALAAAPKAASECPSSPDGRHQVDTSMEEGPNNCFHCSVKMGTNDAR